MLKGLEVYTIKADEGVIAKEMKSAITDLITKAQEKKFTKRMQKALLNKGLRIRAFALPRRLTKSGDSKRMMI